MKLHITTTTTVDAPDGATHYFGNLTEDPAFLKMVVLGGLPYWFVFSPEKDGWYLHTQGEEPHWARKIPDAVKGS